VSIFLDRIAGRRLIRGAPLRVLVDFEAFSSPLPAGAISSNASNALISSISSNASISSISSTFA